MCRGGLDGFKRVLVCVSCLLVYIRRVASPAPAGARVPRVTVGALEAEQVLASTRKRWK